MYLHRGYYERLRDEAIRNKWLVGFGSYLPVLLDGNQFNPIAVIESQINALISLGESGVTSAVDEHGNITFVFLKSR